MGGFTDLQLAKWFEVNVDTIYQWKHRYPEFAEALKVGKAETDDGGAHHSRRHRWLLRYSR